jgi:hypothetical protein
MPINKSAAVSRESAVAVGLRDVGEPDLRSAMPLQTTTGYPPIALVEKS